MSRSAQDDLWLRRIGAIVCGIAFVALLILGYDWLTPEPQCIDGDCINGSGTLQYRNGAVYTGEFHNGKRHGVGTFSAPGGHHYRGQWLRNMQNGFGRYQYPDGAEYAGEFRNGRREGSGRLRYSSGTAYEGPWQSGELHGMVTTTLPGGDRLQAEYRSGKVYAGAGLHREADGKLILGRWQAGTLQRDTAVIIDRESQIVADSASNTTDLP